MPSAQLGRIAEKELRKKKIAESKQPKSRLQVWGRNLILSIICVLSVLSLGTGATAKAGLWDLGDQIIAQVMNVCNPNAVPYTTDTQSMINSVLGDAPRVNVPTGQHNIWSTYNPQINPDDNGYITSTGESSSNINVNNSVTSFVHLMQTQKDGQWLYEDSYSDRSSVKPQDEGGYWTAFKGDGDRSIYNADPSGDLKSAAYANAPTVALEKAYSSSPAYVMHPTYSRYGFETLQWTNYGQSCYSPLRYADMIPSFLYWALVQVPTLMTFGLIRFTLQNALTDVFYSLVYALTAPIATFISPWAAFIAIVIGLPYVWIKSKGSIQKVLSGACWIAAMVFAIAQISNTENARKFTQFAQGIVVKVSGTMACTIANQAFTDKANKIELTDNAVANDQMIATYKSDGTFDKWVKASDLNSQSQTDAKGGVPDKTQKSIDIADLEGLGTQQVTACGSYIDGIYNAFWLGIPLQVWAEGEVGADQAARDRSAEKHQKMGWYQAILNSMYINPNDVQGHAEIQSISRWNSASYTASTIPDDDQSKAANYSLGKPSQWNLDGWGHGSNDDPGWKNGVLDKPVNDEDKADHQATPWKTIPFLLNVKFMCKDQAVGRLSQDNDTNPNEARAGDYDTNRWMYDGTCIIGADGPMISAFKGENYMDRVGLSIVGGYLSFIVFLFTAIICIYIGYQKFVWGFMLFFAPLFLGIAAFPDQKRQDFARKYAEFCISNIIKQIVAITILVITVTSLGQIVFPSSVGGINPIPWMMKPFVALMFVISAILFAFPLKKIMVGAVKGDSSVVGKIADAPKTAVKSTAALAATAAMVAGTGGASIPALANAALRGGAGAMRGAAQRNGGLTGALAAAGSDLLAGKANSSDNRKNAKIMEMAEDKNNPLSKIDAAELTSGGLFSNIKRDKLLAGGGKKKGPNSSQSLANRAAYEANNRALAAGNAAPYATNSQGQLTRKAQRQALNDMVAAQGGDFTRAPEFKALGSSNSYNNRALEQHKKALLPSFTDANGNVDEKGLDAAARQSALAEQQGLLTRRAAIGNQLLEADKALPLGERQYTDPMGQLTGDGQRKLLADINSIDSSAIGMANRAKVTQLMNANPEKYAALTTPQNPNGGYEAALNDANVLNFGANGIIGDKPATGSLAAGATVQQIQGTQAFIPAVAPVVGEEIQAIEAASAVDRITAETPTLSDASRTAMITYSQALRDSDMPVEAKVEAHQAALSSIYTQSGMTNETREVSARVLVPAASGEVFTSSEIQQVAESVSVESAPSIRYALDNYAEVLQSSPRDNEATGRALNEVREAVRNDDERVYATLAAQIPRVEVVAAPQPTFESRGGESSTPEPTFENYRRESSTPAEPLEPNRWHYDRGGSSYSESEPTLPRRGYLDENSAAVPQATPSEPRRMVIPDQPVIPSRHEGRGNSVPVSDSRSVPEDRVLSNSRGSTAVPRPERESKNPRVADDRQNRDSVENAPENLSVPGNYDETQELRRGRRGSILEARSQIINRIQDLDAQIGNTRATAAKYLDAVNKLDKNDPDYALKASNGAAKIEELRNTEQRLVGERNRVVQELEAFDNQN